MNFCHAKLKKTLPKIEILNFYDHNSSLIVPVIEKNKNGVKGMVELAHLMWGGGAGLHFWFKSSNFLGARLISDRNS